MPKEQAFVIMQVGAKDSPERRRADELFDFVIKPALEAYDVTPYRADLDPSPGSITPKMLTELLESRVVIADLTGRNPNVFYELGIAHSYARPLISIADSPDSLPFDAKDERVIGLGAYPEAGLTYKQGEEAKQSLGASLKIVLAPGYVPPSPLRDVAGSASLDSLAPENPVAAELSQMRESLEEIRQTVQPRVRQVIPKTLEHDMKALRGAVEAWIEGGVIGADEVGRLITGDSSSAHDSWVHALPVTRRWNPPTPDDPWGTPSSGSASDPWGKPVASDKPPWETPRDASGGDEAPF